MSYVRRAVHADADGHGWYDAVASRLGATVDGLLRRTALLGGSKLAPSTPRDGRVLALITPHAGLSYCGPTAAEAYVVLWRYLYGSSLGANVRRVFILGPSHHKGFEGVEISGASRYETPFGPLAVDTAVTRALVASLPAANVAAAFTTQRVDEEEHSLELQLPFLSYVLHTPYPTSSGARTISTAPDTPLAPRVSLVPIIIGWVSREEEEKLSTALQCYMCDPQNIFVLSSDFCHWGSRFRYTYHYQPERYPAVGDSIEAMDRAAMALVEAKDTAGWYKYLSQTGNTICGRHPIGVALNWWTSKQNADAAKVSVEFVSYSQSSRCKSKNDSSVSYAAAVICQTS